MNASNVILFAESSSKAPAVCDRPESSDGSQRRAGRAERPLTGKSAASQRHAGGLTPASAGGGGLPGAPEGAAAGRGPGEEAGSPQRPGALVASRLRGGVRPGPHEGPPPPLGAGRELSLQQGEGCFTVHCGVFSWGAGGRGVELNVCFFKVYWLILN